MNTVKAIARNLIKSLFLLQLKLLFHSSTPPSHSTILWIIIIFRPVEILAYYIHANNFLEKSTINKN